MRALGELLEVKGFTSLTVNEITERADINRATFYRHYEDKEDLLDRGINQLINEITAHLDAVSSPQDSPRRRIQLLFSEISRHSRIYRPFFGPHAPAEFRRRFEERVTSYLLEERLLPFVQADLNHEEVLLLSRMTTGVLSSVLAGWLIDAPEKDASSMPDLYLTYIASRITGFLSEEKRQALAQSIVN